MVVAGAKEGVPHLDCEGDVFAAFDFDGVATLGLGLGLLLELGIALLTLGMRVRVWTGGQKIKESIIVGGGDQYKCYCLHSVQCIGVVCCTWGCEWIEEPKEPVRCEEGKEEASKEEMTGGRHTRGTDLRRDQEVRSGQHSEKGDSSWHRMTASNTA